MAKNLRKLGALLLAAALCLGLLPLSALANVGWSNQVVSNGQEVATKDGKVVHSKMITQMGKDIFEITLTVKTMEEIQEQSISPDAAVVLVMDVSNSMKETVDGKEPDQESDQRIYKAKAAAKNFIDSFAADAEGAQRKVALVEFGSSAYTVQGWTDAATAKSAVDNVGINFRYPACTIQGEHTHDVNTIEWGGFFGLQWRCNVEDCNYYKEDGWGGLGWFTLFDRGYEGHTHEQTFNGPHGDTMTDGGGTNIEGGLQLADNLLGSSAIDGIENCYVVLITDGVPTYHVYQNRDNSSLTFIEGQSGGGNYAAPSDYQNVPNVANNIKDQATLYTVSYASDRVNDTVGGQKIDAWLASFANKNIKAGDDIDWGLGQVSQIIQNQSKAWILTDPIPAENYITFSFEDNANIPDLAENPDAVFGYDSTKGELVWNLRGDTIKDSETEGNVTWYTYEAEYTVRLNTAAQGFVEDCPYETNGTTTLSYMLTENGQLQPDLKYTDLVVPKVSGKTPVVDYTINYWYKDKTTGEYVKGKTNTSSAKLWSYIEISSSDYSKENYQYVSGDDGMQQLKPTDTDLVFDLYYDPIPVTVVVKHYVVTTTKTDSGDVVTGPTLVDTDNYNTGYYKGDKFTNTKFLDEAIYTQVNSVEGEGGKTCVTDNYTDVTLNDAQTVINIYYTSEGEDQRTPVDYEIHYFYREDSWQLNADGKYEKVTGTYTEDPSKKIKAEGYHGTQVTAADQSNSGVYTLDTVKTPSMTMTLDKNGTNVLNVYYYKDTPDSPAAIATLTIKHVYKQETINGVVEVEGDNWTERENETVYVGETYAATPDTKGGYTLKTLPRDFTVTINEAGKHYEIVVEYYKDVREPVDIVMNHYYTTYTWTVDPATGEGGWDGGVLTKELEDIHATGTWYAGQTYTPSQIPDGYTYVSGGDARELTSGTNIFDLYYETYVGSEADQADVTVNHIYTTYRSYVDANGNVVLNEPSSKTESEDTYYGMKGDTFTAEKQEKDGFTFVKADTDDLLVTLQGEDGQYNLYYEKSVNELGAPYTVTVQPIYKTYTTSVNAEGQVVTTLTNDEDGTPVQLSGNFYEGQKVTALAADYGKDGFAYAPADEENTKDLTITVSAADGNVIYVVYSKTDDQRGLPVVVLVNNVYTTVTKYVENGEVKEDVQTVTGPNTTYDGYYVGQYFDTTGKSTQWDGYELDTRDGITQPAESIKLEGDNTQVTFYWLCEVDQTNPATVKVIHHYAIYDANPNVEDRIWTVGEDDAALTGYYVGQYFLAQYDFQSGIFDETHVTEVVPGDAATTPGTILQASTNVIHIYYVKNVDTRVPSSVTVIHNYYKDAEALAAGTVEGTYQEVIAQINGEPVMEADSYTATLLLENAGLPYTFHSAAPEGYTVTVDKDPTKNVITINYIRAETQYTVIHVYRTNNVEDGRVEVDLGGKVGDTVNVADIEKRLVYNGNTYSFTEAESDSIVLVADAEANTITLFYDRTNTPPIIPGDSTHTLTVHYVDDEGNTLQDSTTTTYITGVPYTVTVPAIEGYTYSHSEGDALSDYMSQDRVVTLVYTAGDMDIDDGDVPLDPGPGDGEGDGDGEIDIDDGDVPLDPGPGGDGDGEIDIDDGEVPLDGAPQTGDNAPLLVLSALLAISGGAVLTLSMTGKKKESTEK